MAASTNWGSFWWGFLRILSLLCGLDFGNSHVASMASIPEAPLRSTSLESRLKNNPLSGFGGLSSMPVL